MNKTIHPSRDTMESSCENSTQSPPQKFIHHKGGMTVVYDSQGEILEFINSYGSINDSKKCEENTYENSNA